jgi:hypothetical protein
MVSGPNAAVPATLQIAAFEVDSQRDPFPGGP